MEDVGGKDTMRKSKGNSVYILGLVQGAVAYALPIFLYVLASSGTPLSSSAVNADRLPFRARTTMCCCICSSVQMK